MGHIYGMVGKKRYGSGTLAYAYGQIERALGVTLSADWATQRGALRGRLKRLSTLGLPATSPGKGARRLYSLEEACQLLMALLMEDAGLDPVTIVKAIKTVWPHLAKKIIQAASAPLTNPIMLTLQLETVGGPWRTKDPKAGVPRIGVNHRIDEKSRAMHAKHRLKGNPDNIVSLLEENRPGWFAVRNLTDEMRKFQEALHS
jgi:hypothetical protein